MKQTNNAIKFLMAQYRAIFRNANLKMFLAAATAAAAVTAGQAQASTDEWANLSGDAEVIDKGDISYSGTAASTNNANGFKLNVTGGSLKFFGEGVDTNFTVTGGKKGYITQTGGDIFIGDSKKSGATVSLEEFTTTGGNLGIGVKADATGTNSVLNAKVIVIGDAAVEGTGPKVTVGSKGQLGGDTTETIGINAGTLTFSDDVTAKASTSLSVAGGSVVVDPSKTATLTTPSLNVTGGKVTVGEGSSLKIDHTDTNTLSFAAGTIENKGTIDLGKSGTALTVAASDFSVTGGLFASDSAKVTAIGAVAGKKYDITLTGEGTVDLGLILTDAGAKNDKHIDLAAGDVSLFAKDAKASFSGEKIAVLKSGSFGELVAGKNSALTIDGTAVTIGKGLTVTGAKDGEYGSLTLDNSGSLKLAGNGGTVNTKAITVGGTAQGAFTVESGTWKASSLVISSGSATVETGSTLVIASGDLTTKDDTNKLTVKGTLDASQAGTVKLNDNGTKLTGGTLILAKDDLFTVTGDTVKLIDGKIGTTKPIEADTGSILQINDVGDMSVAQIKSLKTALTNNFSGFLQFGGENNIASESGDKTWAEVKDNANVSGIYDDVTVAVDTVNSSASIGNIELTTEAGTEVTIDNSTVILNNASANDSTKKFVANKGGAKTAGMNLSGAGSKVYFISEGEVGNIKTDTANKSSVIVGHSKGEGHLTVVGGVGTSAAALSDVSVLSGSSLKIAGEAADGLYANQLKLDAGSTLDAAGHDVVVGSGSVASTLNGKIDAKTLTLSGTGTHTIAGEAVVNVDTLNGTASGTINVGQDGVPNGSASVKATNLVLNGATLNIDPDYDQHYASAMVMNLTGADGKTLDGLVNVGANSVFAVGFDNAAEVEAALGSLLTDGHFTDPTPPADVPAVPAAIADPATPTPTPAPKAANALVLNKQIVIDKTKGGLHVGSQGTTKAAANNFIVDADGAIVITDKVYSIDPATGKKTGSAIALDSAATLNITKGADLYLLSGFNGADDNLSIISGGNGTAGAQMQNLNIKLGSDLLDVKVNADGTVDISLTADKDVLAAAFTDSATLVRDLLLDVLDGHKIQYSTEAGYKFLDSVSKNPDKLGAAADAAAHAATYAGAQQAAVAAVTTMAEAVGSRIGGLGVESSAIQATGSQANGGVWLSPMYKTVDADGFNAQGASYGADVDLAGVAFGTDTVNGNMRFGAVFNIGSGDADGKGNGNGLKDEFDYYGFGMYSVMGFGNFALVGDASLNVISHEVKGLGLKGEADTTAVTMGVTGQYTISNPAVDVTPHIGARFIRLDTDSYDLTGADGVVANTDFDVQNVFSVPLGVTLSKAFEMGGWSLAPSADLSITFNTGDTDVESSTFFTGARAVSLTTEVLDEVTYGIAVGLGAQYGAFGTQIGVNYTGSENTDAFGVNANARYMF